MRKKIAGGFLSLVLILVLAGATALYELNRLQKNAEAIALESAHNAELAERMLNAVQTQNTAVIKMIMSVYSVPGEEYATGTSEFNAALTEASARELGHEDIRQLTDAYHDYHTVVSGYANGALHEDIDWFANTYLESYYHLDSSIKDYIYSPNSWVSIKTAQLENSVYRITTPGILTIAVAVIVVLMFYFFLRQYYVMPVLKINKGLKKYFASRIPFDTSFESNDELTELKTMIGELIEQSKKRP